MCFLTPDIPFLCKFLRRSEVLYLSDTINCGMRLSPCLIRVSYGTWITEFCPNWPKETSLVWKNKVQLSLWDSSYGLAQSWMKQIVERSGMEFRLKLIYLSISFLSSTHLPMNGALWEKKEMGQWSRDRAFIHLFISGLLPLSDGWVKWRYRPNIQQFAGRDGSSDPDKVPFLTCKLEYGATEFDFNMTKKAIF